MKIFIRKKITNETLYAQVVRSERSGNKVIQNYIGSLGKIVELIKKLQKMQNG